MKLKTRYLLALLAMSGSSAFAGNIELSPGTTVDIMNYDGDINVVSCAQGSANTGNNIMIKSVSYAGDRSTHVTAIKVICEGKGRCEFYPVYELGDPYPGAAKSFSVSYTCGASGSVLTETRNPIGSNTKIALFCR